MGPFSVRLLNGCDDKIQIAIEKLFFVCNNIKKILGTKSCVVFAVHRTTP